MNGTDVSRRKVLAGLGATSVAAVTGLGVATGESLAYTESMAITQTDGVTLEVDWRETYNDQVLEDSRASATGDGAVVSLQDVVPGDSGTFSFRLGASEDVSVSPALSLNLTASRENGINEPEAKAGDDTTTRGELGVVLEAAVWYDEGLGNFEVFGGDNATRDAGERLVAPDASGTLQEVATAVDAVSPGCLGPNETVTVTFGWEFDPDAGNRTQTDAVSLDFEITAEQC